MVLIAAGSEEFSEALAGRLRSCCRVHICCSAENAMAFLAGQTPAVLVVDLMLPGMDGLSLLESVAASGRRPGILAVSGYVSPYILKSAEDLGVDCLMELPCDLSVAADRVRELLRRAAMPEEGELRRRISELLLLLGFSAKLRGYAYLREAVFQMVLDPDRSIVKELYAEVGVRFGMTGRLVEHAIRCAIREAWEHRDRRLWSLYFGPDQIFRPTSARLICTLAGLKSLKAGEGLPKAAGER